MNSDDIRTSFIDFFVSKDHIEKESSSLIPHDPTLMLTAAGMVQFKDYFLGNKETDENRITTIQKCVRTSDIDIIGDTTRHLSFFEMLGNFSIGDYFKKDAIKYAHSYITDVLNVPENLLWYTVYKDDDEAREIWIDDIGIKEDRVQKGNEDNFWHMNIPGPCGPCTEIFYDRGDGFGDAGGPIGGSEDRYVEIWNLVFMELIQNRPYEVVGTLPSKNVDTGMGLERLAMILQKKNSIFETDLFEPIIKKICNLHNADYGVNEYVDKQIRVIADHIRATAFLVGDGVVPTNEGRGYILRRLIRRSLRSSSQLNNQNNDLTSILQIVTDIYGEQYLELNKNNSSILDLFSSEQELFYNTLQKGEVLVQNLLNKTKNITPQDAYKLYDTYGFPFELTAEIAKEKNILINKNEYDIIVESSKKESSKKSNSTMKTTNEYISTEFVGYDNIGTDALITGIDTLPSKEQIIFTDKTSLYFESGGQVSDLGYLIFDDVSYSIKRTVQMPNGAIGNIIESDINFNKDDKIHLLVEKSFREGSSKSHTAAHIVHASLRKILGETASQAGSNVEPGRLRFDFSYSKKVSEEDLASIFELSNTIIFNDTSVNVNTMNIDDAKKSGALAFFGDKYGEDVRVVDIGDHSKELCGGTHVYNSSNIGLVVLINESSIGSNLRRIEMLSGINAFEFLSETKSSFSFAANLLGVQEEKVLTKLQNVLEQYEELDNRVKSTRKDSLRLTVNQIMNTVNTIGKYKVIVEIADFYNTDEAKKITNEIINNNDINIIVIANKIDGKTLIIGATNDKIDIDISKYVNEASIKLSGGASKDPKYSVGGGPKDYDMRSLIKEIFNSLHNDLS
jgi:alanyl-tRNA synthetase